MQNMYIHKQKRILVELLHGLGDTVCAIPMLKVLREHYQEARIDVVCKFDVCAQILRCSDIHIDNYYVLDVFGNPVNIYKFMLLCKENSYDYGIASPHTPVIKAKFFMNFIIRPGRWFGLQKQGLFFDMLPDECHHVKAHFLALEGLIKGNFEHIYPELYPEKHYAYLNSDFCNEINLLTKNNFNIKKNNFHVLRIMTRNIETIQIYIIAGLLIILTIYLPSIFYSSRLFLCLFYTIIGITDWLLIMQMSKVCVPAITQTKLEE